jgi:hypothetical protein
VIKTRLLIVVLVCLAMFAFLTPIETRVIPQWTVQVIDVNGAVCANMRVTESWGDYRLYLDGNDEEDRRFTDLNGYVQFPERTERASLLRRITMPAVTRVATIMHGGWKVDGAVWASGIKDVAWLSYEKGKSPPGRMRVEKCISDGGEQAPAADSLEPAR